MTNEITTLQFNSDQFGQLRVVKDDNGEPWFVAADIAKVFGYGSAAEMIRILDDDEKGKQNLHTLGGIQNVSIINEAGFYHVALQRRSSWVKDPEKREAVIKFQRWVTHEVLPSIRKDGGYIAAASNETDDELIARALKAADRAIQRKNALIEVQKTQIKAMEPKALFYDTVADSPDLILVRELAHQLKQNGVDVGERRLFKWLRDNNYIEKRRNEPTQRSLDLGVIRVAKGKRLDSNGNYVPTRTAKITLKGQVYFTNKFKEELADANA